jgi:cation:H+ antiporter
MLDYFLLVAGIGFLVKGADFLVAGASSLAKAYGVPEIVVGLTIVAFGTSLPELVVSIVAGVNGNSEIVMGNVIGSNICNVLLILGVAAAITPVRVSNETVYREIPFVILASLVLTILVNDRAWSERAVSNLDRADGAVMLSFFLAFLYFIALSIRKNNRCLDVDGDAKLVRPGRALLACAGGLGALILGGKFTVDSAVAIALAWGVSEGFVGLTVVAVGTSLPELATSAMAVSRGKHGIAIGNVVGSNIFNIFAVMGITALVFRAPFDEGMNLDLLIMNLAALLLFGFMFLGRPAKTLGRIQGSLFLLMYGAYTVTLLWRH